MTVEFVNTFANICAEYALNIQTQSTVDRVVVDMVEFEQMRKNAYPYDSQDFADYMNTVFETLSNEDAKIFSTVMGVPIYPHHAEPTHERSAFLQYFQEIYDDICSQGYSPMKISENEDDSEDDTDTDSDEETDEDTDVIHHDTEHPLHITNTESENGRVRWITCLNGNRYEVTTNNIIVLHGNNVVGSYDQERRHAFFEDYDPINVDHDPINADDDPINADDDPINMDDLDELRTLLHFDDEELPEQE